MRRVLLLLPLLLAFAAAVNKQGNAAHSVGPMLTGVRTAVHIHMRQVVFSSYALLLPGLVILIDGQGKQKASPAFPTANTLLRGNTYECS